MTILHHRRSWLGITAAGILLASMVAGLHAVSAYAQDSASATADENQRSEAGVLAVEDHWSMAELTGDTAYLDQMLLPEYRSVNTDGTAHSKAAIVSGAAKRKGTDPAKATLQLATYRKESPYDTAVALHDNTAVVSFSDPKLGEQKGVKSSDIFIYTDGHWHAMYSQHTAVGKAT